MAKCNSTELVPVAMQSLNDAVSSLHTLWTLVEKSLDNGTDWAACEMVHEMLPLIGGKVDAAARVLGGCPTGVFDEALDGRGIKITLALAEASAGACQQ
ncbi:hypothetical protein WJ542_03495 [Paraburkholderia sp. B3]|uniref:hypothetical protein n=1 Tax=Paraburkholderia sp. B3 TaxID=3134791 RepID=UPI00398278FA